MDSGQAAVAISPVAISIRGVSKTYPGSATPVVDDLSLEVPVGEIVALVGPSGCGKTTTLKMVNRLIEPTTGSIEVLGQPQTDLPAHELRRHIGYVIQQVGLFPHLTVERNIGVVPDLLGWDQQRIKARTKELAELVGLDHELLDRYPSALSGGQQQRVGVARALAADPPILLMDEPFSAVDPIVRERLQDDLLALQSRVGKTIVIVTHDIDEAIKLGDRVALMAIGGHLAQYDTPNNVLRAPADEFVVEFLGRERTLRRLSLLTVGDVAASAGPAASTTAAVGDAIDTAQKFDSPWVLVQHDGTVVGQVTLDALQQYDATTSLGNVPLDPIGPTVDSASSLREALDALVAERGNHVAVVNAGHLAGFLTLDDVTAGLSS